MAITEGAVLVGGGSISPTSGGTLSLGSGSLSFGSGTLVIGNGTPGPDSSTLALNSGTLILSDGSTITLTSGDYLLFNTGSLLVGSSAFGIMNPTPFLSETMVGTNCEVSSGGSMVVNVIQPYSFTFPHLTFDLGASLTLPINTSAVTSATLNLPGDLTLNSTHLTLNDLATTPQKLAIGTTFNLIQYAGTETGEFSINGTTVPDGGTFQLGSNTFELLYAMGDPSVEIMVVPEPSTWGMIFAGLGLLAFFRRLRPVSTARE